MTIKKSTLAERQAARKAAKLSASEAAPAPTLAPGLELPPEAAQPPEEQVQADLSLAPGLVPPADAPDLAVTAVVDMAALEASGEEIRFGMNIFMPLKASTVDDLVKGNPHWILFANREPFAKIALADQENASEIAAHFITEDYARSVVNSIVNHGVVPTLTSAKARVYAAMVDKHEALQTLQANAEKEVETRARKRIAEIRDSFTKNISLSLAASANNFGAMRAPLKDALVANMQALGVSEHDAVAAVDAAYFQHGPAQIQEVLDYSAKLSAMSQDAHAEISAAIVQDGRRAPTPPSARSFAEANPNYDHARAHRLAAAAIPVSGSQTTVVDIPQQLAVSAGFAPRPETREEMKRRLGSYNKR